VLLAANEEPHRSPPFVEVIEGRLPPSSTPSVLASYPLKGSANEDPLRSIELALSVARTPEGSPASPGHVIYPHDAGVDGVRHVNLPRCVCENPDRLAKLVDPAGTSSTGRSRWAGRPCCRRGAPFQIRAVARIVVKQDITKAELALRREPPITRTPDMLESRRPSQQVALSLEHADSQLGISLAT
jgi:hypothetical protein